jgi:PHD/YefM family antitoxin component YafN of YafNO toxin-antitoxin module
MLKLHPSILERHGKKAFAVLPYEEFLQIQEELENYRDLRTLRAAKAKEAGARTIPLAKARRKLGV